MIALSPRNCGIPRAVTAHRSGIAESHARERSTARESPNPTRWKDPPLRNREIPRAGRFHRSEIAESRAQEGSIARKSENFARWSVPSLGNRGIPRAGRFYRIRTAIKSLIEYDSSRTKKQRKTKANYFVQMSKKAHTKDLLEGLENL